MKRTHTCGELRPESIGQTVTLAGWAQNIRDHGGVLFIDLRDRYGLTQINMDMDSPDVLALMKDVRAEWVLQVTGVVKGRGEENVNPKLATGEIEIRVDTFKVFSESLVVPFEIDEYSKVGEEHRMKYRYLDMRRPQMQKNLAARHRITHAIREVMNAEGFIDIETPILAKSTPEGARDYLVPSRVHHGHYYALPQSPQIFKQLCMVGGCDRYYQIARCFRDEDLRADRQPEFTQLDLEMSFADQEDVFAVTEKCMVAAFKAGIGKDITPPFPRMTHADAMNRFGCDKPDLRFGIELHEVCDLAAKSEFKVFKTVLESGGMVKGLAIPGGAEFSRRVMDTELLDVAKPYGAKGLAWVKITDEGYAGAPVKFFDQATLDALAARLGAKKGDVMAFVADKKSVVNASLAAIRNDLGHRLNLIDNNEFNLVWITEFPLFEWDAEDNRWASSHHPFTNVNPEDEKTLFTAELGADSELGNIRSSSYDLVLNGVELASGSVRIHDPKMQTRVFEILGISGEEAKERFGFFIDALKYGTPPHAGIAPGIDRLTAMMLGYDNIREVIAFPKNTRAICPMSEAPGTVSPRQLRDLGIREVEEK
jgi:aspartyl-tRNA synthetase